MISKAVLIITEKTAESHFPSCKMEDTSPFLKKKHDQKELYSTIEAVVEQTSKWSFDGGK